MNHYELLGISQNAGPDEIKRAWAKKVREHTPDKDPEGNRRVNEAKATLLDPLARADYDAQLSYGDELTELFEDGRAAIEAENFLTAIEVYKEIIALHSKSLDARSQLAFAYARLDRYSEAITQFETLTKLAPESAMYAGNMAVVYRWWGNEDASKYQLAESWHRRAIELEPGNADHHVQLSRTLRAQKKYRDAEAAIDGAIQADGRINIDDVDPMMELAWIYLFSDQKYRIESVATRIKSELGNDPDALDHAVYSFINIAVELSRDYNAFQDAAFFVRAAKSLGRDLRHGQEVADSILNFAKLDAQADDMKAASNIQPAVVPALVAALVHRNLGFEIPDSYIDSLVGAAKTWSRNEIASAIEQCKRRYPEACQEVSHHFENIIAMGQISGGGGSSGTGCLVAVLGLAGLCAGVVPLIRLFLEL